MSRWEESTIFSNVCEWTWLCRRTWCEGHGSTVMLGEPCDCSGRGKSRILEHLRVLHVVALSMPIGCALPKLEVWIERSSCCPSIDRILGCCASIHIVIVLMIQLIKRENESKFDNQKFQRGGGRKNISLQTAWKGDKKYNNSWSIFIHFQEWMNVLFDNSHKCERIIYLNNLNDGFNYQYQIIQLANNS